MKNAIAHTNFINSKCIHTIIGVIIMVFGPLLKSPTFSFPYNSRLEGMNFPIVDGNALITLSEQGWHLCIVFIGVVYLWVFVDTFWPSLLGILVVGLSPHFPFASISSQYLGNPSLFTMFFIFFFVGTLINSKIIDYISHYLLSRKYLQGRPWALITTLFVATFCGAFVSPTPTLLTLLPVIYMILNDTGYKPGDTFSTFLVGNVIGAYILAISSDIVKGLIFIMQTGYNSLVHNNPELGLETINVALYLVFALSMAILTMCSLLFIMRFIVRVDVEKVRHFDISKLSEKELPPMSWKQKTIITLFIMYLSWMILPSILPSLIPASTPIAAYMKSKASFGVLMLFTSLILIRYKGEPLVELEEIVKSFQWKMYFLLAAVFFFSTTLTKPETNLSILLELSFSEILNGVSPFVYYAVTLLIGFVLTNLLNSIVIAIALSPIMALVALNFGLAAMPVVVCFLYIVSATALVTPGAGVPAAFLHGNKGWLPGSCAFQYAFIFSGVLIGNLLIFGIPLAKFLFG